MNTQNRQEPPIRQLIQRKLARWCTDDYGDDLYYLYEAVQLMRSEFGEEVLKEYYKDRYEEVINRLAKLGILLHGTKIYYDGLDKTKKLDKETEIESERFMAYKKQLMRIPLIDITLYEMLVVLVRNTPLKNMKIPSSAFKIEERKYVPVKLSSDVDSQSEDEDEEDEDVY